MSLKYDLSDPALKEKIAQLPEKMLEFALQVLMAQAHVIVALAQINVLVDTGTLRDTGRVERGGRGMHWRQVRVRFGGYLVNPKTGKLCDYARIVEQRYPYLRPAVEQHKPVIAIMLKNEVVEKING